jgi:hypothetical protein
MTKNASSGGGSGKASSKGGGIGAAPKQSQAQINRAVERNPNSPAYWQTRQMNVPAHDRVQEANTTKK